MTKVSLIVLAVVLGRLTSSMDATEIRPGETIEGIIRAADPIIETELLATDDAGSVVRGMSFRLNVKTPGPYYIELYSYFFDAYLVLRDGDRGVVTEDDDGLIFTHSQLILPALESETTYTVDVCALNGGTGPFELRLHEGTPRSLTAHERRSAELREARKAVRAVEEEFGPNSLETGTALYNLSFVYLSQGHGTAKAGSILERVLRIRESKLGSDHRDVAVVLNDIGVVCMELGEHERAERHGKRALAIRERELGALHPYTALSLANLSKLAYLQGDYRRAAERYRRVLGVFEAEWGLNDPRTLKIRGALGATHQALAEYSQARTYFEEALSRTTSLFGAAHATTVTNMNNLAGLYVDEGRYGDARRLFERALSICIDSLAKPPHLLAVLQNNLGSLLISMGEYERAWELLKGALSIREEFFPKDEGRIIESINNLATLSQMMGRYDRAASFFERLESKLRSRGDHPILAYYLSNLAQLQSSRGNLEGALEYFERADELNTRFLGSSHPQTASNLRAWGICCIALGHYAEARERLEKAFAVQKTVLGLSHPDTAGTLAGLGWVSLNWGDHASAMGLLDRALEIRLEVFGKIHPDVAWVMDAQGIVFEEQEKYEQAEVLYRKAMEIRKAAFGDRHARVASSLTLIRRVRWKQGLNTDAVKDMAEAVSIATEALGEKSPLLAICLNNLGCVLDWRQDFEGARMCFEKAASIHESNRALDSRATYCNLASLYWSAGRHREAWRYAHDFARCCASHLERSRSYQAEFERFLDAENWRWALDFLESIARLVDDPEFDRQTHEELIAWKGKIYEELVHDASDVLDDEGRAAVERLREIQKSLSREYNRSSWLLDLEGVQQRLAWLHEERAQLERKLAALRRTSRRREAVRCDWDDVAAKLPADTALIDLYVHQLVSRPSGSSDLEWSAPVVTAWIVRPEGRKPKRVDLGPADDLREAVGCYVGADASRGPEFSIFVPPVSTSELRLRSAELLYEKLWAPLAPHLNDVRRVFISSDGFLGALPFGTLKTDDGRFLVEDVHLVYVPTVASLLRDLEVPASDLRRTLLVTGNVDYDAAVTDGDEASKRVNAGGQGITRLDRGRESRGLQIADGVDIPVWRRLAYTGVEANEVFEMHKRCFGDEVMRVSLNAELATEKRLRSLMQRFEIVHIATHAFFAREGLRRLQKDVSRPVVSFGDEEDLLRLGVYHPGLLSGLVLAGANCLAGESLADGYLVADEVARLDLGKSELIVLSACETALGKERVGEGMIGLRRAFHLAGAKSVISTAWSVGDQATAVIMRDFYRNLFELGMPRGEALRSAQIAAIQRQRKTGVLDPRDWGGFLLSGRWR